MKLIKSLKNEYINLFNTMQINDLNSVKSVCNKIYDGFSAYNNVSIATSVPWYFIAIIHNMESSLNFKKHLHNGDPLSKRTTHVPKGRPLIGTPPFSWELSAIDAISYREFNSKLVWDLPQILYQFEKYNGFGYRLYHSEVKSPYLWAGSNHYTKGKYGSDGKFNSKLVSKQIGCAVLLRYLIDYYNVII